MITRKYYKITRVEAICLLLLVNVLFFSACKETAQNGKSKQDEDAIAEKKVYDRWLIDLESVQSGCDRVDCIRSIDAPKFISVAATDYISDEDLVIGIKIGDEVRCYPHNILNWHEIVNDAIGGNQFAINYCPLTGSGMAWNRNINGKITDFGVSGMLYNSNVIPYDRNTRSAWSQMKQLCVNGELMNSYAETFQTLETTWATWKKLYPDSKVVSTETGMPRDYMEYPYGEYRESKDITFDVEYENDTLHPKERLFGVIQKNKAKCYRFTNFKGGVRIVNDTVFEKPIIVVGSERDNFITAFENPNQLKYLPVSNKLPAIIKDSNDNLYDVFGYCVEGPEKGKRLTPMNGFMAFWFGWYAFYPDVTFM